MDPIGVSNAFRSNVVGLVGPCWCFGIIFEPGPGAGAHDAWPTGRSYVPWHVLIAMSYALSFGMLGVLWNVGSNAGVEAVGFHKGIQER